MEILVKDILSLMDDKEQVIVEAYAYDFPIGDSRMNRLRTAKDCLENLIQDWLNGRVIKVERIKDRDLENICDHWILIEAVIEE